MKIFIFMREKPATAPTPVLFAQLEEPMHSEPMIVNADNKHITPVQIPSGGITNKTGLYVVSRATGYPIALRSKVAMPRPNFNYCLWDKPPTTVYHKN